MPDIQPEFVSLDTQVDLTTCDREPIHQIGRVQSFGALVSFSSDWIVNHASVNLPDFLGEGFSDIVGMPAHECFATDILHNIRGQMQVLTYTDSVERMLGVPLTGTDDLFDLMLHISGRNIILEIERSVPGTLNHINSIRPLIDRVASAGTIDALCKSAVRHMQAVIGFDRVMVYRFEQDESGVVIAESKRRHMESYLGLRYPASDIPKQARALYKRSLFRMIADVSDPGIPILPGINPEGEPLDLSISVTRSVSPIHLEYLKNMGVAASVSISILVQGELWGMFVCHNNTPKILPSETRTAAELYGQMFAFLVAQIENSEDLAHQKRARVMHDQMMVKLADDNSILNNFAVILDVMEQAIVYDGVAGWVEGEFWSTGETPTKEEFAQLLKFLNTTAAGRIFHTDALSKVYPPAAGFLSKSAGMLVLPVSRSPRDFMVFFRREIVRSVKWAGNPEKPAEPGPNGLRLTPRKSFEAWREIVDGKSQPWSRSEIGIAESLRLTIIEVVLRMSDKAIAERTKAQAHQELLIAELNHRVRNILNLIKSLILQSKSDATDVEGFSKVIGGRIHSLARAHDQITRENWNPASLIALIRTEVDAYLGDEADRVRILGPDPMLVPTAFTTVALVIHELITNSVKYGALCDRNGSLTITIEKNEDGAISLNWQEQGGPPISSPPIRRGFGTTIIERSIPFELNGMADIRYEPTGLRATFVIPESYVASVALDRTEHNLKVKEYAMASESPLSGDVLILEDNMLIALDAEDILRDLGADTVHLASNCAAAIDIVRNTSLSFALLDVNLGNETSMPVADLLDELKVPFHFVTGYGDNFEALSKYTDARIVQKPYTVGAIQDILKG